MEQSPSIHGVKLRKSFLMRSYQEHEIKLFDRFQEVKDAYRKKIKTPKEPISILYYKSHDSQVYLYIFDQESYNKFKEHVSAIPQSTPVRVEYSYYISKSVVSGKVLVVKSGVNNKVHEVPIFTTKSKWDYVSNMIKDVIPKYFFPSQFIYNSAGHRFEFNDPDSWEKFVNFAIHEDNRNQRYFEVTAGEGSIEEQIFMCRRDYAEKVLPLMQQHQIVFLDQSLPEKEKLEKMVALTKQMADLRSGAETHKTIEQHLHKALKPNEILADDSAWSQLYKLEQTFIREVDEGDWNGNGTYWNENLVKYYNTDSSQMLPILQKELLRKDYKH